MPVSANQRAKLLHLMDILLDKTDEHHPLTVSEVISELASRGITAERKTIYTDMELLRQFGINVETQRDRTTRYYVAERQFELPELKLLVDAVQSSRFIPEKKSAELIAKLSTLASMAQAKQLRRQVYVLGRSKSMNEAVYYSIDQIHTAINENRQISFRYFDYDSKKCRVYRKNGSVYQTTPISLCWNDDNYYLIAYCAERDGYIHYRVDRMSEVTALDAPADNFSHIKISVAEHVRRVFGMYRGEHVRATLSFDNSLVNVVLDHFGKHVSISAGINGWFHITVEVAVSPVFFGWIFQFGNLAKIEAPDSLIAAIREMSEANVKKYAAVSKVLDTG